MSKCKTSSNPQQLGLFEPDLAAGPQPDREASDSLPLDNEEQALVLQRLAEVMAEGALAATERQRGE